MVPDRAMDRGPVRVVFTVFSENDDEDATVPLAAAVAVPSEGRCERVTRLCERVYVYA